MKNTWTPGEEAPKSANYVAVSKQGEQDGPVYLKKGQRFPATQHSGSHYEMEQE